MKNKFYRRALAFALALALVAGVSPVNVGRGEIADRAEIVVNATDEWSKSETNTTLGTSGIESPSSPNNGWIGNYVYYGKYNNNPVKYRVLDPNSTAFGVSGGSMLLDCDTTLTTMAFHESSNVWSSSSVKTWLNGDNFYKSTSVFTSLEKDAIASSTKSAAATGNKADGKGDEGLNWASLDNDKIFLLDAKEATNTSYGYTDTDNYDAARSKYKFTNFGSKDTGWRLGQQRLRLSHYYLCVS